MLVAKRFLSATHRGIRSYIQSIDSTDREQSRPPAFDETLPLYNLLSFGWGEQIHALFDKDHPINRSTLRGSLNFKGRMRVMILSGRQVNALYQALREYGESSNRPFVTPVLPDGFREGENRSVQKRSRNNQWRPLNQRKNYLVVLDHWLSQNGYEIEALDQIFLEAKWTLEESLWPLNTEIIIPNFHTPSERCESSLKIDSAPHVDL